MGRAGVGKADGGGSVGQVMRGRGPERVGTGDVPVLEKDCRCVVERR